jgi:CheY-like chemotaxis protein
METILLVEDSKFLRAATEHILTKAGYRVICAGDGDEALKLAQSGLPQLILLDMLLPKLSGPEVLRSLKKNDLTGHIRHAQPPDLEADAVRDAELHLRQCRERGDNRVVEHEWRVANLYRIPPFGRTVARRS